MKNQLGRGFKVFGVASLAALAFSGCGRSEPEVVAEREPEVEAPAPVVDVAPVSAADGPARSLAETPFEFSWDMQFPTPVHTSWIDESLPDLVFFQLLNGQIHALDASSGETKWVTRRLPRLVEHKPDAVRVQVPSEKVGKFSQDDRLYVISGDTLFCFDAVYGQLIWRHDLGSTGGRGFLPSTSPVFQGSLAAQRIFIGDWEGRIQVITYDEEGSVPYWLWQWNLNAQPLANPVVTADGLTYVADIEGHLHCFGLDREKRWSFNTVSRLTAPPLLRGRAAYLGSRANVLHILNRLSGEEITRLVLPGPVTGQPMAFNRESDRVYVWTGGGPTKSLHSIRTIPDSIAYQDVEQFPLEIERVGVIWSIEGVDKLISSTPNHFYVTRHGVPDRVLAVDRRTGAVDWHWDINQDRAGGQGTLGKGGTVSHLTVYQDPADANRSIFTVDAKGYVVAYRLFGQF